MNSTTPTTIQISWTVPGPVVESYKLIYEGTHLQSCPTNHFGNYSINGGSTSYTITELEEHSNYTVTVTAVNEADSVVSIPVSAMTMEAGEIPTG